MSQHLPTPDDSSNDNPYAAPSGPALSVGSQFLDGLPCCCLIDHSAINYRGKPESLVDRFMKGLGKPFEKKGISLTTELDPARAALHVRFVRIEQGNQLLRYLLPFLSPAFIEIEADLLSQGNVVESFYYRQNAQAGLFGGTATGMLNVCADRIAKKLSKGVLKRLA